MAKYTLTIATDNADEIISAVDDSVCTRVLDSEAKWALVAKLDAIKMYRDRLKKFVPKENMPSLLDCKNNVEEAMRTQTGHYRGINYVSETNARSIARDLKRSILFERTLTGNEWSRLFNVNILDPDGWRNRDFDFNETEMTCGVFVECLRDSTTGPI